MSVPNVDQKNFDTKVLQSKVPVLVDFWAPWCGPCRAMSGIVDELAREVSGRAEVVKVNIDEASELAAAYGVQSIPTFAVLKDGQVRGTMTGVTDKGRLLALLEPQFN